MRKEVFYSLAALGFAPLAADAAVVNTIPTDKDAWQKSASTTSVAVNAQTGIITISSGGEVTQELAELVPGVYTLKFQSVSSELAIKILGKAGNATTYTTLEEGSILNEDGTIEFTIEETMDVKLSVNKATSYYFGGATLTLNFDFEAAAKAMADTLASFKANIKGYATDAAEGYDAQITELENRILLVQKLENVDDYDEGDYEPAYENWDAAKLGEYKKLKLYNDVEEVGSETPSDLMAAIKALRQNAFTAEKAFLQEQLDAANEILNADGLAPHAADAETTDLRNEIAAAIAALKEGDATNDIQSKLETLADKTAAVKAKSDAFKTKWGQVKSNLEALVPKYSELADWKADNLAGTKYAGLAAHLQREIDVDKDSLNKTGINYKNLIETAYFAGTLWVWDETLNEGEGGISTTEGLWNKETTSERIPYGTVYEKLIKALGSAAAEYQVEGTTQEAKDAADAEAYEAVYEQFKAMVDVADEAWQQYKDAYNKALTDANAAKVDYTSAGAPKTAYGNMKADYDAAETVYYEATTGKWKEAKTTAPAHAAGDWKNAGSWSENHYGLQALLETLVTLPENPEDEITANEVAAYEELGLRGDEGSIDAFYTACGADMEYYELQSNATAAFDAIGGDFDKLVRDWAESIEEEDAVTKGGFDAVKIWLQGNAKYTKNWFTAEASRMKSNATKVTLELFKGDDDTKKAALVDYEDSIAALHNATTGDYHGIDYILKYTPGATPEVDGVWSGKAVDYFNKFAADWARNELLIKNVAVIDSLLKLEGDEDATDRFNLAYADADGIAFKGSEILQASYSDQIAGMQNTLSAFSDSLKNLAKGLSNLNGQANMDCLDRMETYLGAGAEGSKIPTEDYPFNKIINFIKGFNLGSTYVDDENLLKETVLPNARTLANLEDVAEDKVPHDVFAEPGASLVSNRLYTQLKNSDQADIAATIKNIEAKVELIDKGVDALLTTKDINGAPVELYDATNEVATEAGTKLYGTAATDILKAAYNLNKEVADLGDLQEPTNENPNLTPAYVLEDTEDLFDAATIGAGDVIWTNLSDDYDEDADNLQTFDALANGNTEGIDQYTAHLDNVLAQLKVIQSQAEAAKASTAATNDFYKTTDETLEVNGNTVSPKDIFEGGALDKYFQSVTNTIERNDYRQYPGVKNDGITADDNYPKKKAEIYVPSENPEEVDGIIADVKEAIETAKAAGTLQKEWEKKGGIRDMIKEANGMIDTLLIWANTIQDVYSNYLDVCDAMIDANLIAAADFMEDKSGLNWTAPSAMEGTLLWKEVYDKVTVVDNYEEGADGNAAKAFYQGVVTSLKDGFYKAGGNPNPLVQKLDSTYQDLKAFVNSNKFKGVLEGKYANINKEFYTGEISKIVTKLSGLEQEAEDNNTNYATQKDYVKGNVDEEIKPVETLWYEVNTEITSYDQTTAATGANGYIAQLKKLKDSIDVLKDWYTEEIAWDQLRVKYRKGEATSECADSLVDIYNAILRIARTQKEGYDDAVAADNEQFHKDVLEAIKDAEEAYDKAVKVQESFNAKSKALADAIEAIEEQRLQYNADLKEQKDLLVAAKAKYNGTGDGSYNKWCDDYVGKSYESQSLTDKKTFTDITAKIEDLMNGDDGATTVIRNAAKNSAAVNALVDLADSLSTYFDENAKAFKLDDSEEAVAANKAMRENTTTGFGYIHFFDKDGEPVDAATADGSVEKDGFKMYADSLLAAFNKEDDEFNVKYLDEALAYLPANFTSAELWSRFNGMAESVLLPLYNEAKDAYDAGNAKYGKSEDWADDKEAFEAAKKLYDDAKAEKVDHEKQSGLLFEDIAEALQDFLDTNLYTITTNEAAAKAKAKEMADATDGLWKQLDAQKTEIAKYGANGSMQDDIQVLEADIEDFLKSMDVDDLKGDSTDISNDIVRLAPEKLASAEALYIQDQIDAVKEMYNKLEVAGSPYAADAKKAIKDLNDSLTIQNARITPNIDDKAPADKIQPIDPQGADETDEVYEAKVKKYNEDVAKREYQLARLQAACDSLLALEGIVADTLKKYAALAGVTDEAIAEQLEVAIGIAKDKLADAQSDLEKMDLLTEEQKAALEKDLADADNMIKAAEAALAAAQEEDEDGETHVVENQNAIQQMIDAAEAQIVETIEDAQDQNDDANDTKVISDAAANAMLNADGEEILIPVVDPEAEVAEPYFNYSIAMLEGMVEDIEEALEDEEGYYQHLTPSSYAPNLNKIKNDIATLKAEIEAAKASNTAFTYMKKEDTDYIFKKKGDKIAKAIDTFEDLIAELEMKAYITELNDQIAALESAITPNKYTTADYNSLTDRLKAEKEKIYKKTENTFFGMTQIQESGLAYEIVTDGVTVESFLGDEEEDGLYDRALAIEEALKEIAEDAEDLAIIDNPDEPGDIVGDIDGDGFVTSDDVEQFLDDLLYGNLPEEGDDEFDIYDVNGDGLINIADAQGIQNLSLGLNVDGSVPSDEAAARRSEAPAGNVTAETTQLQNGAQRITLTLNGNFDWTGFQMDVKGAEVLSENAQGVSLKSADKNGTHRIVAFGAAQGNGQVITLDVQGNAKLGTITFTTLDAQAVSFKLSGTTGIYGITTESSNVFYDLSGKIVKGMKKGVNIIRDAAGKAKKAIMK